VKDVSPLIGDQQELVLRLRTRETCADDVPLLGFLRASAVTGATAAREEPQRRVGPA